MATDDDPADRLYRLPLSEFVAARNALAKELTAAGDREAGRAVRALKKPSVAAWALNRVAQDQPDEVAALLQAGDAVRVAQDEALAGDASGLRAASQHLQIVVTRLTDAAAATLDAPDSQRDRIRETLRAAAVDEEAARALQRGRLVEELTPAGFGLGAGDAAAIPAAPRTRRAGAGGATAGRKGAVGAVDSDARPAEEQPAEEQPAEEQRAEERRIEEERVEAQRLEAQRLEEQRAEARRLRAEANRLAAEAERAQAVADAARQAAAEAAKRADEAETAR